MERYLTLVVLFSLTLVTGMGALLSRTYVERLQYQTGFESCMTYSNYLEHHVLTRRQKWKAADYANKQAAQ